ncbi:MAG: 50S ribosomal protein L24e [Candidatus Micrarchaeia archaeon]
MKCSFCGKEIEMGEGLIYVTSDGSLKYFCSSKCYKNSIKLRRNPKKLKWIQKK